ncbi:MBL fold metallo-hydrolase [Salimicrobium halophilum]|uniref:Glyoxylase, beta-lactamase superfamily II n=1 Tax=Salimicrobium halophilum TaxID=86666 RepID=A0A1G8TLF3_9BACI|nr:MBL fold metallo-hydrolase [Salimicrobium halophilum]SDJ42283.1 Glyoxylase, beta-lactamase superfamily II [Salimicrobium halophilum]
MDHMSHAVAEPVTDDVAFYRARIVNVVFIGKEHTPGWILVDTGIEGYEKRIIHAAESRYGTLAPRAIVLTHGHFDHSGSAAKLSRHWKVPIYVHEKEEPYVTGKKHYPVGNATVGGGVFTLLSPFYPTNPKHLKHVEHLSPGGVLPFLDEWEYIETPGHTPGHISLFRSRDRLLISGDALLTVNQESLLSVITQYQHLHGPPAYFTMDEAEAEHSIQKLQKLSPSIVVPGHGTPMKGKKMKQELDALAGVNPSLNID